MIALESPSPLIKQSADPQRLQNQNPWLIWQLADSAFPTGGFAHSAGLEAAWQHGEIRTRTDLQVFLRSQITQCGHGPLPFVSQAHVEPERLPEFDTAFDVFTTNHVANRASRLQGAAFLSASERAFGIRVTSACRHLAPVFGAVLNGLGVDRLTCMRLFLFGQLRGAVNSAVRLGVVGPLEAQAIQNSLAAHAEDTFQKSILLTLDDIAQTAPLADLWQGAHDRLYSRLFQS